LATRLASDRYFVWIERRVTPNEATQIRALGIPGIELTDEALGRADAVVILTDHTDFDYERVVDRSHVLIDARHAAPRSERDIGSGWIVKG